MMAYGDVVRGDMARIAGASIPWDQLDGRTVLVTGAGGLVASYLVDALLALRAHTGMGPARVVGLVRSVERSRERFAAYVGRDDFRLLEQDVTEPVRYNGRIDAIVHAASQAAPSAFATDPVGTYLPNVIGTHRLLERAHRDAASAVLFVSSGAVHGVLPEDAVVIEDVYGVVDPLDLRSSYAESKRMGETMCKSWHAQFGVPARSARLGHTYGPGMSRRDERAFAQFVFAVVDGRDIVLNSDGSAIRPYCYIGEAVEGLLRVLLAGAGGESYLVTNPDAMCSIRELAETLAAIRPDRGVHVQFGQAPSAASYLPNRDPSRPVSIEKMRSIGWRPRIGVREGFTRTIDSYL